MKYNNYIDIILRDLFNGSDTEELQILRDIFYPREIKLDKKEVWKILNVMESLALIKSPKQGFGDDLVITLDKLGIDITYRFDSYSNYLRHERRKRIIEEGKYWFSIALTILGLMLAGFAIELTGDSDRLENDIKNVTTRLNSLEQRINKQDEDLERLRNGIKAQPEKTTK
jgi:hypothetical protein